MRTSRRLFWGRGIAGLESPAPAGITEILRILRTTGGPDPCRHPTGTATGFPKSNRVVSPEFRSSINHKTRLQERSTILQIAVGNFIATALLC